MSMSLYQPRTNITLPEIEELVSEFNDGEKRYIEVLTLRLLENAKRRGAQNFGHLQAREIILRLIVKTEGAILDF